MKKEIDYYKVTITFDIEVRYAIDWLSNRGHKLEHITMKLFKDELSTAVLFANFQPDDVKVLVEE